MARVEVTMVNDACIFGWLDRLLIAVWWTSPPQMGDWFEDQMRVGMRKFGTGVGHLAVILPKAAVPESSARSKMSDVLTFHGSNVAAVAVVFESQGFLASTVRSVATGIVMLAKSKERTPFRPCGDLGEAATFLGGHMSINGAPVSSAVLTDAVSDLKSRWTSRMADASAQNR